VAFDDDKAALQWFDAEALNFISIVNLSMEHELYRTVWQIAVALWDYLRLLRNPGRLWVDTTKLAQEATRIAEDRYAEGWIETSLADGYRWLGQYDNSQQLFEHALTIRQRIGDRHGQAWALAGSGFLAIDRGRLKQACGCAQEALSIFREVGDRHGEASALFTVADAYHGWQRYDDALRTLEDSFRIFDEIGNHDGQGLTLVKMAEVYVARGEHQQALSYLNRSLKARRLAGSRWGEADGLARRGHTLQALGRSQDARESWETALALYDEVKDPRATDIRAYLQGEAVDLRTRVLSRPGW
jgi:tetratricopeptide (TPR) repeat protein